MKKYYRHIKGVGGRDRGISEFEASLICKVSSSTARATQRNPVSKNQRWRGGEGEGRKKKRIYSYRKVMFYKDAGITLAWLVLSTWLDLQSSSGKGVLKSDCVHWDGLRAWLRGLILIQFTDVGWDSPLWVAPFSKTEVLICLSIDKIEYSKPECIHFLLLLTVNVR